ncbi:MAG: LytR C-terminal domain-containing protein [Deltaproteobacteria bacterium]|nr:LytR C-terminal domain-containing protein [Deltaproteobacteria bacterium]MBW2085182.1 LytR C-terminal domain-containing protein [Deltaproteobacteria bacterium]
MTHQDDPEGQRPASRLFSGIGLNLFLIVLLSAVTLSFIALGLLRSKPSPDLPQAPVQNKVSKPVILLPGQFEVKTAKAEPVFTTTSQPVQHPASAESVEAEAQRAALPSASAPGQMTTSTTSTTTTTEPTIILAPGEAVKVAAKKFELPPPKWQTLDKNWDKVKPVKPPQLDKSNLAGAGWKQLELGQAEKVQIGPAGKTPSVATVRTRTLKKPQPPKKTPAKTSPQKKPSPPKISKPKPVKVASKVKKRTGLNLAIINESGKSGMGQVFRDVLEAMGYPVTLVKDKPQKAGVTIIYYKPTAEARARRLGDRIPELKKLAPITWSSQFDIVVIIR